VKKKIYIILLTIMTIFSYMGCYYFRDIFFVGEAANTWKWARLIIVGVSIAFIIAAILYIISEWKRLKPYFLKLYTYRSLLYQFVRRDFKAKYKRSVLGILWTVLNPLLTMLVLTIVFSALFRFDIPNYPVYLLSGQVVFTFFSEATNMAMTSILGGGSMIKKVYMPKYIFPVSTVLSSLVNFLLSLIAVLLVMLVTRAPFHWAMLLIPIPIFYIFIFSMGVGLILSAAVVFFRDMTYLYGILLTALTYFTPLFYPISIIPHKFRFLISLNPMFHFVEYFRTVAIYGGVPSLWQNVVCLTLAFISLAIGLYVFYKKQDRFILYI
jgi:ABC-2 type transport system permease protein